MSLEVKIVVEMSFRGESVCLRHKVGEESDLFGFPIDASPAQAAECVRSLPKWFVNRFQIEATAAVAAANERIANGKG